MRIYVIEKMALETQEKALREAISFYIQKERQYRVEYYEEKSIVAGKMLEHCESQRTILEMKLAQIQIELEKFN